MRLTGPLAGEGINRGFLKVRQYCCSGVRRVDGSEASFTCCNGRTGAAMVMCWFFLSSADIRRKTQQEEPEYRNRTSCHAEVSGRQGWRIFFSAAQKSFAQIGMAARGMWPEADQTTKLERCHVFRLQGCKATRY